MQLSPQQLRAVGITKQIIQLQPVFFDTETTGIGNHDQVIELTVMDYDGVLLFDELVRPTCPISEGAAATHHITETMLVDKGTLKEVWSHVQRCFLGRFAVGYNVDFDLRMLHQTAAEQGVERNALNTLGIFDMMQVFALFASEEKQYGHPKWFRLGRACESMGLLPDGNLHRSRADTDLTRRLTYALAEMSDQFEDGLSEKQRQTI